MSQWPSRPLAELLLPTDQRDPRRQPTEPFVYVDIASVDNETKTITVAEPIFGQEAPSRARKVIRAGDVLVSTVRPNLNAVALVPDQLDGEICSTGFSVLRPSKELVSKYLFGFVRSSLFIGTLVSMTKGANYPAVSDRDVKGVCIPAPPLAEQERIVRLLDEADAIRKLRAQADQRTADLIPALFHDMFGDPVTNPMDWPTSQIANIATKVTDGTHLPPKFDESGVPFLFVSDIVNGTINFSTRKYISSATFADLTKNTRPERGDILYSTVGSYGVAVEVETDREFAFQRHIGHIKPNRDRVDSTFLTAQLNTPAIKSQVDRVARGIAQKTVNLAEIRRIEVILPPLVAQRQFVAQLKEVRSMQSHQAKSNVAGHATFEAILDQFLV